MQKSNINCRKYSTSRRPEPAKGLYEKLGFTNKYLEMRLIK
jgi:hypothetical protein